MATITPSEMSLLTRERSNGRIPPSLLPSESETNNADEFLTTVSNAIESEGLSLKNGGEAVKAFQAALKMTESTPTPDTVKDSIQRRALLLAIIGCSPTSLDSLQSILRHGYLSNVKKWLEDILTNSVGSVDLLLHLLDNICGLPVTKEMVTSSKLGKHVASIEKHKICVGTLNESAIKERVGKVKEMWSASVKRLKKHANKDAKTTGSKRSLEVDDGAAIAKKPKVERKSLLSGVMKKSASQSAASNSLSSSTTVTVKHGIPPSMETKEGGAKKRIKWADINGGELTEESQVEKRSDKKESRSERKNRDRMREKELLREARKSKLVDKEDSLDTMVMMYSSWHQPKPLPPDPENPPVQTESAEVGAQASRMRSVLPVNYLSEEDIPSNPSPLTQVEQANEIASQSSAVPCVIPFFVPSQEPVAPMVSPPPAQVPMIAPPAPSMVPPPAVPPPTLPPPGGPPGMATLDMVKSMGLPPFLAGQNIQALQTLSASPGLLNAFVDANGAPDQGHILNLVQTLTQNIAPGSAPVPMPGAVPPPMAQPTFGQPYTPAAPSANPYQAPPPPQASIYGGGMQTQNSGNASRGYRGDQNVSDGNLHLSGYGPTTTPEAIIQLFAPYVKVDEVVPKNGFMFVNTNDAEGAKRAREALTGVMLGGGPLRINLALRRNKNPALMGGGDASNQMRSEPTPLPRNVLGQIDYDNVRDDRGNPATKNLFVAGYGAGTTEKELTDVFNQHTQVTGIVMKGSFSFVNTTERNSAVNAREALTGTVVNGGVLRINFAKESGRLGTSFDSGYAARNQGSQHAMPNYYGRTTY